MFSSPARIDGFLTDFSFEMSAAMSSGETRTGRGSGRAAFEAAASRVGVSTTARFGITTGSASGAGGSVACGTDVAGACSTVREARVGMVREIGFDVAVAGAGFGAGVATGVDVLCDTSASPPRARTKSS